MFIGAQNNYCNNKIFLKVSILILIANILNGCSRENSNEQSVGQTQTPHINFDFTKISKTGEKLPTNAVEWSCVLDNLTGLMWEVKTDDDGLRDKDKRYTWYDPNINTNGGHEGSGDNGDNTLTFTQAVNAQSLCGYNDWRLPSKLELESIVNYDKYDPAIDDTYFPDVSMEHSNSYWSSSTSAAHNTSAWIIWFDSGGNTSSDKIYGHFVRLVRSSQ